MEEQTVGNPIQQPIPTPPESKRHSFLTNKLFLITLVIVVLFTIIYAGIYIYLGSQLDQISKPSSPPLLPETSVKKEDPTANWKTYINNEFGFVIKYPENARLIIPRWNSISDKSSVIIIKFNFETGCIDKLMGSGIKEEDAIIECIGDDVDIAILGEKQKTLQDFVNEEANSLSKNNCNIQTRKIGTIDAFELSNKSKTGGCLVGNSSFYYLENVNKILKIGISDNTDDITNQILSTFKFTDKNQTKGSLKSADWQIPVAGICGSVEDNEIVTVIFGKDNVPMPRCVKVTSNQKLKIINNSDKIISGYIGQYKIDVTPGKNQTIDATFGSYLLPGVHIFPGGAEIWLE